MAITEVRINSVHYLQDDQQQKSAEQSYLIEQIDYPFINDCDHPLQPHVQYGGGLSMSSDQSMQHYNMHENTNDRRNIGKCLTFR